MTTNNGKSGELEANSRNGYLICRSCHGYYQLKDNESPDDFNTCECGSPLEYKESMDNLLESPRTFSYDDVDEYEELQEIVDFLKNEARERKELLRNLSERVTIQEQALNNINQEKLMEMKDESSIWDLLEEKDIENEIYEQKRLIESSIQQEEAFLSRIQQKRSRSSQSLISTSNDYLPFILIIGIVIVLLVIILLIAAM